MDYHFLKVAGCNYGLLLGLIKELKQLGPFVIALFSADKKPSSLQKYLSQFVKEMKYTEKNGISISGKVFTVKLDATICDAPARSFLKERPFWLSCM